MMDATMREVVQRLRAEHRGALLELVEFDHALDDILQEIELLEVVSRELQQASKNLGMLQTDDGRRRLRTLQADAGRVSAHALRILVGFSAVRREVLSWNISRAGSSQPGSNGSSSPSDAS